MVDGTDMRPDREDAEPHRTARKAFIAGLSLFRGLPDPVLDDLAKAARPMRWPAESLMFQRGDPSDMLICLERGRVKISLQNADGREFTLQHLREGAIMGEVGILDAGERTADATAVSETSATVISRQDFLALMTRHPELGQAAIRHLCALVRYTTDHIEMIALYGLEMRVARFLLSSVLRDGRSTGPRGVRLELDLSQAEIADVVGSSRPKVNRALAALEHAGTIVRKGRVIQCDIELLRRAADLPADNRR